MRTILIAFLLAAAAVAGESVLMFTHEGGLWVPIDGGAATPVPATATTV